MKILESSMSNLLVKVKDAISDETKAISLYDEILGFSGLNSNVVEVIQEILDDEKDHLVLLTALLKDILEEEMPDSGEEELMDDTPDEDSKIEEGTRRSRVRIEEYGDDDDEEDEFFDQKYSIGGNTSYGEGDYGDVLTYSTDSPEVAVKKWFEIGKKCRASTDLYTSKKSYALEVVKWADDNRGKIEDWHRKYNCPYKLDYLLKEISNQVSNGCRGFYENDLGDTIHPFCSG